MYKIFNIYDLQEAHTCSYIQLYLGRQIRHKNVFERLFKRLHVVSLGKSLKAKFYFCVKIFC